MPNLPRKRPVETPHILQVRVCFTLHHANPIEGCSLVESYAIAAARGDFGPDKKWVAGLLRDKDHPPFSVKAKYRPDNRGRKSRIEWHHPNEDVLL